ncbi:Iron transport multicopper oxidase fetC [Penicillium canariense]|uniref:Iron transport multicopper oxidase fetC n=1 Tax=Penicillium canariense TaxID=189055 RepID=A0A9W9I0K4_9EURO|nr:Iron transport multicopper oxidase fetC [Penicillium canariense]KAJ5159865.1 Iron transport multicopper oxidase fetC [Penicillium canariense]
MVTSAAGLLVRLVAALCFFQYVQAKTVTYDFNVTWVTANPDGLYDRKVVGINGQWPLPVIEVDKGDQLVVNMHNGLGDKRASIHFHGMFQNGTNEMDGPSMVTQCPVSPGSSITYNFTVNQNGTYWYHCHTDYCYPDGYRQALIVHDKDAYFNDMYDEEYAITMSDWYHEMIEDITFIDKSNPTGAEPIPNAFLFNDTLNSSLSVEPGKTYLLRLINVGAFVAQYFYIEDHTFKIVEIDGVYTDATEASILYISVAQRYSVLVTMKNSTEKNYPIVTVADSQLLDTIPSDLRLNHTNWLEYNKTAAHPQATITVADASDLIPFDDMSLVPHDRMELLPEADLVIDLTVYMENLDNGADYALLNNISYTRPKVPTLFTVMSAGELATNSEVYGDYTHPMVLGHNQVVEIILNNGDGGSHPFHLHGHNFQLINRAPAYGEHFYDYADGDPVAYDPSNHTAFPKYPARRDTFVLPPQGYFVIRFVADNPGVWFFHCHIDWHLQQGLGMTLIEAPLQIQERLTIPQNHYDVCEASGVQSKGNAAGNTVDYLDLSGQNKQVAWLPAGFTAKGIVAMVFSCVSAFLGMAFISVYGASGIKMANKKRKTEKAAAEGSASTDS